MGQPVVHFEIMGKDHDKTVEFYKSLFDWETEKWGEFPYTVVKSAAENAIGGGLGGTQEGQHPMVTFYVQVDDVQAYLDKAESGGGKTLLPPTPIYGVGTSALFTDPDGNIVGLFKPLPNQ